jgi:hypothetical protein
MELSFIRMPTHYCDKNKVEQLNGLFIGEPSDANTTVKTGIEIGGITYYVLPNHQLRAVLQRLRQMSGLDLITPRQIRDRAR